MKDLEKRIDELVNSVKKDEHITVICSNENDELLACNNTSVKQLAGSIATLLHDFYDDNRDDAETVAKGIFYGVCEFIKHGDDGAANLAREIMAVSTKRAILELKEFVEKDLENENENENDDEDEDCSSCKNNKTCPLPSAVKYRKENGIKDGCKKFKSKD